MNNKIKRFFEPALYNKIVLFRAIISGLVQTLYAVINIYFIQKIIDLIEKDLQNQILNITIYFFIFNIIYFIFSFISRKWSWADIYYSNIKTLNKLYMSKFNTLDNTSIETVGTGKIISILSKGFETWSNFLAASISIVTKVIVSVIATFIILKSLGNIYIIIFFIFFIVINIILSILNQKSLNYRIGVTESKINYDKQLVRMIMSKFEILQNNKNNDEINKLNGHTDSIIFNNNKLNNYLFSMFVIPEFMLFIVYLSVLLLLNKITIGFSGIVSIFLMLGLLKEVLNNSIGFFKSFTKSFYSIEKVWDFFDNTKTIKGINKGKTFEYINGDIKIDNLDFSYGKNKVFNNLNLNIKGGKKTAFVGASGSGKTTLIKLISGFLKGDNGNIFIDGKDLKDIKLSSYYKNIGYLTQEPSIFDGTILENLTYGINEFEITDKKLNKVIKLAKCEFIYDFEEGLSTEIGERGVRLSGGQKQRLAIAKIFMKNPKIIILDEPTSALDSFSEESITESFDKLFYGRTVLIIAHRLQTVKKSDDIIVFDNGKIIERGNHEKLVQNNGYYKKMLDLQSGF
ncbi:MAG: ABC transporter ATP-binding protein [Candidatus Gracilibacteria bacterium]